jgi:hypothetical protein
MGFCGGYVLISLAAPFYLKKIGEAKPYHWFLSIAALAASDRADRRNGLSGSASLSDEITSPISSACTSWPALSGFPSQPHQVGNGKHPQGAGREQYGYSRARDGIRFVHRKARNGIEKGFLYDCTTAPTGTLVSLHRYPVKSMMGEELNAARVTPRGVFGDRAYALCDSETHKIVSAKNPRKWPGLFSYRAAYVSPPEVEPATPAVRVTLPDGNIGRQLQHRGLLPNAVGRAGPSGFAPGGVSAGGATRGILARHRGAGSSRPCHR